MTGLAPVFREGARKGQWSRVDHTTTGRREEENIAVHLYSNPLSLILVNQLLL